MVSLYLIANKIVSKVSKTICAVPHISRIASISSMCYRVGIWLRPHNVRSLYRKPSRSEWKNWKLCSAGEKPHS